MRITRTTREEILVIINLAAIIFRAHTRASTFPKVVYICVLQYFNRGHASVTRFDRTLCARLLRRGQHQKSPEFLL